MNSFTWFDSFSETLELVKDKNERALLALAIIDYGAKGDMPDLPYPLNLAFTAMRDAIDNSVSPRGQQ